MRLAAAGTVPRMLDAVLLTHLHSDHISDLNDVVTTHWVMSLEPDDAARLRAAPHQEVVDGMLAMLRPDVEYRLAHHADLTWEPQVEVVEVTPGVVLEDAGVRVVAAATDHRPVEPTRRLPSRARRRCRRDRRRHRAVRGARRAVPRRRRLRADRAPRRPRAHGPVQRGSSTRSTTTRPSCRPRRPRHAANVGTLVLTHQIPTPAPGSADEWIAIAREHFAGEIVFGEDLTTVTT